MVENRKLSKYVESKGSDLNSLKVNNKNTIIPAKL